MILPLLNSPSLDIVKTFRGSKLHTHKAKDIHASAASVVCSLWQHLRSGSHNALLKRACWPLCHECLSEHTMQCSICSCSLAHVTQSATHEFNILPDCTMCNRFALTLHMPTCTSMSSETSKCQQDMLNSIAFGKIAELLAMSPLCCYAQAASRCYECFEPCTRHTVPCAPLQLCLCKPCQQVCSHDLLFCTTGMFQALCIRLVSQ